MAEQDQVNIKPYMLNEPHEEPHEETPETQDFSTGGVQNKPHEETPGTQNFRVQETNEGGTQNEGTQNDGVQNNDEGRTQDEVQNNDEGRTQDEGTQDKGTQEDVEQDDVIVEKDEGEGTREVEQDEGEETQEDVEQGKGEGTQDKGTLTQDLMMMMADDTYRGLFDNVSDYDGEKDSDGYPEDGKTSSGRSTPADETPLVQPAKPFFDQPATSFSSTIEDIAMAVYTVLYSKKSWNKMNVIKEFYDSSAVFQDPLVIAEGHNNIYLQFELLSSLVTDLTTQFSAVTVSPRIFQAKQLVVIDAVVNYHFLFFQRLSLRNTTIFVFDDKQKIVSHEDVWSVSDLIKNIPIIGWIYGNIGRKISAFASNQIYSFCKSRSTVLSLEENVK